jgi:hypothetical protein
MSERETARVVSKNLRKERRGGGGLLSGKRVQ